MISSRCGKEVVFNKLGIKWIDVDTNEEIKHQGIYADLKNFGMVIESRICEIKKLPHTPKTFEIGVKKVYINDLNLSKKEIIKKGISWNSNTEEEKNNPHIYVIEDVSELDKVREYYQ